MVYLPTWKPTKLLSFVGKYTVRHIENLGSHSQPLNNSIDSEYRSKAGCGIGGDDGSFVIGGPSTGGVP